MKKNELFIGLVIVLCAWMPALGHAAPKVSCAVELAQFLKTSKLSAPAPKFYGVKDWFRIPESQFTTLKMRRPLADHRWVDVVVDAKSCEVLSHIFHGEPKTSNENQKKFTDQNLEKVTQAKKISMIYIWSPQMIYSMTEFKTAEKLAKSLKMNFVPVLDGEVPEDIDQRKLASINLDLESVAKSLKLQSNYLMYSNMTVHYPKIFFAGSNKVSSKFIAGVMPEKIWKAELQKWSKEF